MLNRITKITNRSLSERLEDNSNVDNWNSILNEMITHGEICKSIKKLNNDQLSRDDFIRNKFIKPCAEMLFHYILFSFTSFLYIHVLFYIKWPGTWFPMSNWSVILLDDAPDNVYQCIWFVPHRKRTPVSEGLYSAM